MAEVLKLGRDSATGSLQLFLGKILSTVILAVGTIVLGWLILEGDYGLYAIALIPATTILLFQDWGVGSAMTKFCAQYRASNNLGSLRSIIVAGLTFMVISGAVLTVISVLISGFIASAVFARPESALLLTLASITVLSSSVFVAVQGIFIGFEAMKHFSLILVVQAVFQGFLAPALVYFGYGAYGAVLGYALASIIVGVVSLVVLYFSIFRSLKKDDGAGSGFFEVLKPLLHYGVPLAVASISAGMLVQFFYFMMAIFCSDAVIGNYRVAINFGTLLTFFSFPVSTVLFPVFSKLHSSLDRQVLKSVFKSAVKYTAFLLVPATFAMMVLAQPIIGTLYGGKWLVAPWFLFLSVLTNLLAIVGNLAIISLLAGLGETKFLMKLNLLAIAIGVPLGILLIPVFGIEAVIISALIAVLPGTAISLYFVRKKYDLKVDYNVSLRILLASVLAATATYGLLSVLKTAMWLQLLFGFLLFVGVYLLSAPLVGAISPADVSKLRTIFSGFGLLSTFLFFLLGTIERILKFRVYRVTMKNK